MEKKNLKCRMTKWVKMEKFTIVDCTLIGFGMIMTVIILSLTPFAWILSIVTAYLTVFYVVVVILGI